MKEHSNKRENNRRVNDRVMQSKEGKVDSSTALDAGLVVTESNETESERHVSSSRSGKDTHAEDADINSVNDKQPLAEVDRNTIPDSTNMCHRGGEIEQNAEECQVSCPLLDPSFDNMTTEFSNHIIPSLKIFFSKRPLLNFKKTFQEWKHNVVKRMRRLRTQEVLDLEDRRKEKRGQKEWPEVRNTRAKEGSTNSNIQLIKTFVKYLKEDLVMFVQLQGDRKEPLDKVRIERICQRNKNISKEYFLAWRKSVDVGRDNLNFKFKY
ncbi:hypothetical protein Tco_0059300 [Tanacetum coccineum]